MLGSMERGWVEKFEKSANWKSPVKRSKLAIVFVLRRDESEVSSLAGVPAGHGSIA